MSKEESEKRCALRQLERNCCFDWTLEARSTIREPEAEAWWADDWQSGAKQLVDVTGWDEV